MKHRSIFLFVLGLLSWMASVNVQAQDFKQSDKIFEWLQADEVDSIYALFSAPIKAQMQASQLKGIYARLISLAGSLEKVEPWKEQEIQGMKVHDLVLFFSKEPLMLRLAYFPTGELAGLNFLPIMDYAKPSEKPADTSAENFSLVNDEIQLPATFQRPFVKKNATEQYCS